jgi:hypothetical protein
MSSRKISSFISCASLLLGSYMPLYLVSGQLPALADPASTTAAAAPAAANPASSTAMPASATATPAAVAMPSYPDPVEVLPATFKNIQKLVLQFYPKAKFDVKPTSMHFDEKCKSELGYTWLWRRKPAAFSATSQSKTDSMTEKTKIACRQRWKMASIAN